MCSCCCRCVYSIIYNRKPRNNDYTNLSIRFNLQKYCIFSLLKTANRTNKPMRPIPWLIDFCTAPAISPSDSNSVLRFFANSVLIHNCSLTVALYTHHLFMTEFTVMLTGGPFFRIGINQNTRNSARV